MLKPGQEEKRAGLEEIGVLVRLDHVASCIVNANHGIATENVSLRVRMKS